MDNETRRKRIAQRFLISILPRYGEDAPSVLRAWRPTSPQSRQLTLKWVSR